MNVQMETKLLSEDWGWGTVNGTSAAGRDRMCLSIDKNYFALLLST